MDHHRHLRHHTRHAWPAFQFHLHHPSPVLLPHHSQPRRILIAFDAAKSLELHPFLWTLHHLVQAGDVIILLAVLQHITNPMGYKTQADASSFNGTSERVLRYEIKCKLADYQENLRSFCKLCKEKQAQVDIRVKAGYPLKLVVLQEASAWNVASVVLDRRLKDDEAFYAHSLFCKVAIVTREDEATIVRGDDREEEAMENMPAWCAVDNELQQPGLLYTAAALDDISFSSNDSSPPKATVKRLYAGIEKIKKKFGRSLTGPATTQHSWSMPWSSTSCGGSSENPSPGSALTGGPGRWQPPPITSHHGSGRSWSSSCEITPPASCQELCNWNSQDANDDQPPYPATC